MTEETGTSTMSCPLGVAAIFTGIEPEHAHVLGPMGLWLDDDGDAVAGFFPRQRSFVRMVLPILGEDFVNADTGSHGGSPKKKPDHEDRASCGNGGR